MARAPGEGTVTGGSPHSGSDSVKSFSPFMRDGRRARICRIASGRNISAWRAISTMGAPGTLSTPARGRGSTAIKSVP
jgi:hypothetical protein